MSKIDKQLRYFVKALLKYAEKDGHINPGFTTEQIPSIFKGWSELEFSKVHHGAGAGCCIYIGPDQYSINVHHCNELNSKLRDSNRTKWRLRIAAIALAVALIGTAIAVLKYATEYNQHSPDKKDNINFNSIKGPQK